jgi:hypothetical protein
MATSDNPLGSIPKTDIDEPEDHQHDVPIGTSKTKTSKRWNTSRQRM